MIFSRSSSIDDRPRSVSELEPAIELGRELGAEFGCVESPEAGPVLAGADSEGFIEGTGKRSMRQKDTGQIKPRDLSPGC